MSVSRSSPTATRSPLRARVWIVLVALLAACRSEPPPPVLPQVEQRLVLDVTRAGAVLDGDVELVPADSADLAPLEARVVRAMWGDPPDEAGGSRLGLLVLRCDSGVLFKRVEALLDRLRPLEERGLVLTLRLAAAADG